jgi:hypothetical protein
LSSVVAARGTSISAILCAKADLLSTLTSGSPVISTSGCSGDERSSLISFHALIDSRKVTEATLGQVDRLIFVMLLSVGRHGYAFYLFELCEAVQLPR